MRIAVDAMGGDFAPEAIVEGAVQAAEEYGFTIILVGQEDRVRQELAKYKTDHLSIEVQHAPEIVDMHDLPSVALRRKKNSSMHKAIYMTKNGEADAAVSAGNTGAGMAIAKLACRVLDGIERPALATVLPNISGMTVMIDVGANVDCKPDHLLQFAVMGSVYAKEVVGIANPRVGLLSIGEEESKGNTLTKEAFEPLSKSALNFIGNVEGRDVFNGRVDVIVCDGFIGNVVLKVSESLAKTMGSMLKDAFSQSWRTKLGYLLVKPGMDAMRKRMDYEEYGGAPLLGLNGVVVISHGSSKARATKNAIRVAAESVNHHLNQQITETMFACEFDTKARAKATSLWRQLTRTIRPDSHKEKDQKEDAPPQETPPITEDAQAPQEAAEAEGETAIKRRWWGRKSRGSKPETLAELPLTEEASAPPVDESAPLPEFEPYEEPEQEKKSWWKIRSRSAESREESATPTAPQDAPTELPPPAESPAPEPAAEPTPDTEKEAAPSRKMWWKRREAARQEPEDSEKPDKDGQADGESSPTES